MNILHRFIFTQTQNTSVIETSMSTTHSTHQAFPCHLSLFKKTNERKSDGEVCDVRKSYFAGLSLLGSKNVVIVEKHFFSLCPEVRLYAHHLKKN